MPSRKGAAISTANRDALTYKAVPTAAGTQIDAGSDTTYDEAAGTHTDMNYRLYFGARADEGMRSGHYRTQVLLSVVADAKFIGGLGGITRMSEMTSEVCKSLGEVTVNTPIDRIPIGQLIDDREGGGIMYWVAKLADGNCWMTQNMAYSGISNTSGNFNQTKKNKVLVPNNVDNPTSYTETDITGKTPSSDPYMVDVINGNTYNAHYLIGNYYTIDNSQAADACNFTSINPNAGWVLPTSPSTMNTNAINGSFSKLLGVYNVADNGAGSTAMRKAPFYYIYSGRYIGSFDGVGSAGSYWSSTSIGSSSYYILYLNNGYANPQSNNGPNRGLAVRCVIPGD